jgi:protoporphyrinogen oxidase
VSMNSGKRRVVVLGGGVAGLSASYVLSEAGSDVALCERDSVVGGLSRTVVHGDYRFDLGGHRFFTKNRELERFLRNLMGEEFIMTPRSSKIYLRGKYFDYPLRPANALFGLGIGKTVAIVIDYTFEKIKNVFRKKEIVSLEDWVVSNFGRTMFNLYFKEYSEKVWGLGCDRISEEWVAQRIKGLSLTVAVREALFKSESKKVATLIERFLYPELGIGRLSERFQEEIEKNSPVYLNCSTVQVNHDGERILSVNTFDGRSEKLLPGEEFISSIPLTNLVTMLSPAAPVDVTRAAKELRYRSTIIVAIMIDRDKATDLTWIYFPEKKIPFGRIHEPKNWSKSMAPPGKTTIVAEYFCFENDDTWKKKDHELVISTIKTLDGLGFIKKEEVLDSSVIRIRKAYPLFEVGYKEKYDRIIEYLQGFENLQIIGRGGMFKYYNMDHAIETGIKAAENLLGKSHETLEANRKKEYLEEIYQK